MIFLFLVTVFLFKFLGFSECVEIQETKPDVALYYNGFKIPFTI